MINIINLISEERREGKNNIEKGGFWQFLIDDL